MEAPTYVIYKRERYWFILVCTFRMAITSFEVNVDVQKGVLRF